MKPVCSPQEYSKFSAAAQVLGSGGLAKWIRGESSRIPPQASRTEPAWVAAFALGTNGEKSPARIGSADRIEGKDDTLNSTSARRESPGTI